MKRHNISSDTTPSISVKVRRPNSYDWHMNLSRGILQFHPLYSVFAFPSLPDNQTLKVQGVTSLAVSTH